MPTRLWSPLSPFLSQAFVSLLSVRVTPLSTSRAKVLSSMGILLFFSFSFFKLFVRISQIQICRVYASTLVFLYQSSNFGMKKSNNSFYQVIFLLFCYSCFELRVVDHCSPWSAAATRLRRNMDNKNSYRWWNSPMLVIKCTIEYRSIRLTNARRTLYALWTASSVSQLTMTTEYIQDLLITKYNMVGDVQILSSNKQLHVL